MDDRSTRRRGRRSSRGSRRLGCAHGRADHQGFPHRRSCAAGVNAPSHDLSGREQEKSSWGLRGEPPQTAYCLVMAALPPVGITAPANAPSTLTHRILAWAVHGFTLTGAVWASLAALALIDGRIQAMWLWLGIALIVDGVDGTLARKADVLRHAPMFDGRTLDNILDYLTWSFLPAVFMF